MTENAIKEPSGGGGVEGGRRFSFEHLKGRGKELPQLNKCEQEGREDPNIGPYVIT